jgi:hypothetical protein
MRGVPFGVLASFLLVAICSTAWASPPVSPRIDYVDSVPDQPQKGDPATILYDDFDQGNPGEKDTLVTTKYNDSPNLRRHGGNTPVRKFPIFSTAESGHWVTVECCFRLNTPGKSDGESTAWVDGKEDCTRRNLNWTGTWNAYGINALFLENYWNDGSVKEQERHFDNYVIATKPVGPMVVPLEPTIVKTAFEDPDPGDTQSAWQVRIASDPEGKNVAWDSGTISSDGNSCVAKGLKPAAAYWTSVRQCDSDGEWSDWSPWHGWFRTAAQ